MPASAIAQPAAPALEDDGYCDYVEGTAAAAAATLFSPQVFGQFGYIEQPTFAINPSTDPGNLRVLAGVRYSLSGIFEGSATKSRAKADCRRHKAQLALAYDPARGPTNAAALAARLKVYEEAQAEAERILADAVANLQQKRITAPEATSTRLRVEELRTLAANTRRDLAAIPRSEQQQPVGTAVTEFRTADAAVEASEARIRRSRAYDVSVRVGIDRFLEGTAPETNFFGVVQVGINLGALWMGSGNDRAAQGRKKYAKSQSTPLLGLDPAIVEQIRATADVESKRVAQLQTLITDLGQQIDALANIPGEDSKRFRETLWFDWIKAKAELAYVQAHVEVLRATLAAASS